MILTGVSSPSSSSITLQQTSKAVIAVDIAMLGKARSHG